MGQYKGYIARCGTNLGENKRVYIVITWDRIGAQG